MLLMQTFKTTDFSACLALVHLEG